MTRSLYEAGGARDEDDADVGLLLDRGAVMVASCCFHTEIPPEVELVG